MDQKKIGSFLKELRKDKGITQEQFAETLGVSGRTVSRWETGSNMPDLDILIQIADYYDVEIREILDGERKSERMNKELEETVIKVADYSVQEKITFTRRIHHLFIAGVIAFIVYMVLDINGLTDSGVYEDIASFLMGIVFQLKSVFGTFLFGLLLLGVLYTSRCMSKIRAFKMRLLKRK